jgi:Domain of unknown function (DUF4304)
MPEPRDEMIAALREHVIPVLRERGFTGSFPHFRRISADAVHLLTFQFHPYGGSFIVEIASCSTEADKRWGGRIPANKLTSHDIPFERLRLGAVDSRGDHWFKFDDRHHFPTNNATTFHRRDGDPYERAAKAVLPFLDTQAEEWWKRP